MTEKTEFKKRIDDKKFILNDVSLVGAILVEDVQHFIGEAKKDFPAEAGFGFKDDGTKIYDVYDWFEKWFGCTK